jgi:hypothetical protein
VQVEVLIISIKLDGLIARPFDLAQLIITVEGIWSIDEKKN